MNDSYIDSKNIHKKYPNLVFDVKSKTLVGTLNICKNCRDEIIRGKYSIIIDLNAMPIPYVYDVDGSINTNYSHRYTDGHLCLATDIEQILFIEKYKKISLWIEKYVESYFVSYEYFNKYGVYPFGEYSHGKNGILEFYENYFNLTGEKRSKEILEYILFKKYRGHDLCPCGSLQKVRKCHKDIILEGKNNERLKILEEYYRWITNEKT